MTSETVTTYVTTAVACVVKDSRGKSKFWYCVFRDATGKRVKKSTGQTARSKAMQMCVRWQQTAEIAARRTLTEERAREIISEIVASVHGGDGLKSYTIRQWFEEFYRDKVDSQDERTAEKYEWVKRDFLDFLGTKADQNILTAAGTREVREWRDALKGRRSPSTVNNYMTVLSSYFNGAWRAHVISNNPCTALDELKDNLTPKKRQKQPFTVEQVKALIEKAEADWRGLIKVAFYTGARLQDAANLRFRNVDFDAGKIGFEHYSKHGDDHEVPMHESLADHLLSLPAPKSEDAFLFPSLAGRRIANLSKQFGRLMDAARIKNIKVREAGNGAARDVWALGFHSLRRSNVSIMANRGVSEERRMAITAHSTREVHKSYTTHELSRLREPINVLPTL